MIGTIANISKIPDLRRRILFTLFIIFIHRVGSHIPVPFIDADQLSEFWQGQIAGKGLVQMVDMFSGRAFRNMTVFALGIMPYISASIILQLLTVVWPRLEKISKEGEAGRKKINQYTRYGTVLLSAFQAFGTGLFLMKMNLIALPQDNLFYNALFLFVTVLAMTTGTTLLMWLGEKITEKGIGNGISIIITIGIMASYPFSFGILWENIRQHNMTFLTVLILIPLVIVVSMAIILIQEGSRKIPIQHARRVVGRRQVGGMTNYLPLKVNTGGVIPVIFSSSILMFPTMIFGWAGASGGFAGAINEALAMKSSYNLYRMLGLETGMFFLLLKSVNLYIVLYAILTGFFCFFYPAIIMNPSDTADNLKKMGAFIPGRRPGKQTADYIDYVLTRITTVGAVFLVVVALIPDILYVSFDVTFEVAQFAGGTGLIIVVGVVLDTMKQIESHLVMRHYDSFRPKAARRYKW
ncbi:MAG: preprotein translocase subunit SecY [Candidatus Sumerlaeia bacterium]